MIISSLAPYSVMCKSQTQKTSHEEKLNYRVCGGRTGLPETEKPKKISNFTEKPN